MGFPDDRFRAPKLNLDSKPTSRDAVPAGLLSKPSIQVMESAAQKGEWTAPAAQEISIAMALSDFSARWRGSRGFQSQAIAFGTVSIGELNQSKTFDLRNDT